MLFVSKRIVSSPPNLIVFSFDTPHLPCDERTRS